MPTMMSSSYRSEVGSRRLRTYFVLGPSYSYAWSSFSATIIGLLEIMFWFVVLYVATLHCCKKRALLSHLYCCTWTWCHSFISIIPIIMSLQFMNFEALFYRCLVSRQCHWKFYSNTESSTLAMPSSSNSSPGKFRNHIIVTLGAAWTW